uniref:Uncharacterized protein n=1 Tax=Haptolina brevifila TaxID=156173 RepID=A0A7S2MDB1_9EUKA|mmetsp:Transcript_49763/g.99015  ORF Transcript_49763/g.99015 Transcript_49763/m.99015 type:complete len:115 (+) Transcript_49763:206-550(+)
MEVEHDESSKDSLASVRARDEAMTPTASRQLSAAADTIEPADPNESTESVDSVKSTEGEDLEVAEYALGLSAGPSARLSSARPLSARPSSSIAKAEYEERAHGQARGLDAVAID